MRFALLILLALFVAGVGAAQTGGGSPENLAQARREAETADARARALDAQAQRATDTADKARARADALVARIEAAEADLTLAQRRIDRLALLQAAQRVRLAERQRPVVRLTAALETMARRPAALALMRPGTVADTAHVRALLAAALPEIRRRTAALRAEVARSAGLRDAFETARGALVASRENLRARRASLARFEATQRARSSRLAGLATAESDRALALGEEARRLAAVVGTRRYQAALAARLSALPGPVPRPDSGPAPGPDIPYVLPVEGRLITGVGEISDGGVHSRGLTFETAPETRVVAPANGRVLYAAPFGSYANVVIIDHGRGFASVVTNLATLAVRSGDSVGRGALLGRTGVGRSHVEVELRRDGRPVPIAELIAG